MKNSKKIALCGMFGAVSTVIMLFGSIVPMATYLCPAMAAFLLLPVCFEYREKTAFTLYGAVSALSLMLIPEKEFVLMYVFVFGFYSVFKFRADKIRPRLLQLVLKAFYALVTTFMCYYILLVIFPNPLLAAEMGSMSVGLIIAFFAVFVFTFLMYDFAASGIFILYYYKFRPKLFKGR